MRKTIDHVNQKGAAEPTADEVFEAIHSVMHRYRSEQYRALRDAPGELTHMDGKVLDFFARHPGATQKHLAEHSGRDKGQLARLVGGLKDRGLLDANADEADRRSVKLQLTEAGKAVQKALRRRARRLSEQAVATLSAAERGRLVALLRQVDANLRGDAA